MGGFRAFLERLCYALAITLAGQVVWAESFSKYREHKQFDAYFSKYTKRYFGPGFDWKFWFL